MFASIPINWPPQLVELLNILSAFNLNLDLTAPECAFKISFRTKWAFIELFPVIITIFLLILYGANLLFSRMLRSRQTSASAMNLATVVSILIAIYRVVYLYLTRTTLTVFNCSKFSVGGYLAELLQ